jgi:hypothetical protein
MDNPKKKKRDRKLVSKQEHEIKYLLRKWDITREQLLEVKGKKRSRKVIEALIVLAGYKKKEFKDQKFKTIPARKKVRDDPR